jgi:RNA-directed DNA polymerase
VTHKRQVSEIWLGADAKLLSDAEVERRFALKISKAVRDFEEDVAQTS